MPEEQVITLRGEDAVAARAGHLFRDVADEFLCAATDLNTWSLPSARPGTGRLRAHVADGLRVRKLYTPAVLADDQRGYLLRLAAAGAQVRICETGLPHETIIIDRRVMLLAGPGAPGDRDFTVTTSPTLIEGVYALYDAAWATAVPLADRLEPPTIDPEARAVLEALGTGLTDEAAARRLGLSLRTYRRRVAALLRTLESDSRFQAGLRAGELGLS
jgi:DNA-binding NarL/FixJ family response regulator